jgi:hypothetical protein
MAQHSMYADLNLEEKSEDVMIDHNPALSIRKAMHDIVYKVNKYNLSDMISKCYINIKLLSAH